MKKLSCIILIAFLLISCDEKTSKEVVRVSYEVKVINNDLETVMPGALMLTENYLLWTDPISSERLVHVLDRNTGQEYGQMVSVGQGPQEFISPNVATLPNDRLYVFDINSEKTGLFSIADAVRGDNSFLMAEMEVKGDITRLLSTSEEELITFSPSASEPFTITNSGKTDSFGKLPFENVVHGYNHFQGQIAYNSQKESLIYTTFKFPYLALYQKEKNSFKKDKEVCFSDDYEIRNGVFIYNGERRGAIELALTADYIVTLERDRKFDDTDESRTGRDFTKLPQTVFLYNYDLQLEKIVDLGMPILRLAADTSNNTLYAIVVNPDFMIVKCEL